MCIEKMKGGKYLEKKKKKRKKKKGEKKNEAPAPLPITITIITAHHHRHRHHRSAGPDALSTSSTNHPLIPETGTRSLGGVVLCCGGGRWRRLALGNPVHVNHNNLNLNRRRKTRRTRTRSAPSSTIITHPLVLSSINHHRGPAPAPVLPLTTTSSFTPCAQQFAFFAPLLLLLLLLLLSCELNY